MNKDPIEYQLAAFLMETILIWEFEKCQGDYAAFYAHALKSKRKNSKIHYTKDLTRKY